MIIILSLDRNQNMCYIFFTHTVMATKRKFKFPIIIIMPENNVVLFYLGHISFVDNINGFLNELTNHKSLGSKKLIENFVNRDYIHY